ncbi:rho GTPase-activating protein 24 isoform X1 [Tachysurus ichikawai]
MEEQACTMGVAPRQKVLRHGWLRKQGGFVKTWHSRWFVLRGEQLYYYKDEDESKALSLLRLWNDLICLMSRQIERDRWTQTETQSKHRLCVFSNNQ